MAKKLELPEFHPDAWERFERAAKIVAKSPPQHREAKGGVSSKAKASRRRKGKRSA